VWVCLADTPPSFDDTVRKDVSDRLGGVELDRPIRRRAPARRSPDPL